MWWLTGVAQAHIPVILNTGPEQDWCGAFASALQGDIVLLDPGDYTGPCELVGKPPDPLYPTELSVFAARDVNYKPRFHWDGVSPHILSVSGEQIQLAWLVFPDVQANTAALAVQETRASWLLDLDFAGVAGTAIRATGTNTGLRISEVGVVGLGGTGFDLGCSTCATTGLVVDGNVFGGLTTSVRVVGDGLLSEIVSDGGVALDLDGQLSVERSAIRGDVVLRDAVVLESNITVGTVTVEAGVDGAKFYGNTLYSATGTPLVLTGWGDASVLQNNAISAAIPPVSGAEGNVACVEGTACWRDPEAFDFYPLAVGALCDAAVTPDTGYLFTDWCGFARAATPTPGALESLGDPIAPIQFDVAKSFGSCLAVATFDTGCAGVDDTDPPKPDDTDTTNGADPEAGEDDAKGCGCASTPPAPAFGWMALGFTWLVRRARYSPRKTSAGRT